jgi:thiamine-phosphate pyrophosphorylase
MKIEFSPAVQLALEGATRLAAKLDARRVSLRHLLCALLTEEEGAAAALVTSSGGEWPRIQAELGLPIDVPPGDMPEVPLDRSFPDVMSAARELAIAHGAEGTISSEHVLLALLSNDSELRSSLEGLGVDFELLRKSVVGDAPPIEMDGPLFLDDPKEDIDVGRILDAGANRAREALRVLEDHARFAMDDAVLTRRLKQLRHDLAEALSLLPARLLLESRDTPGDVGTTISTDAEWQRPSLISVVQANAKRLQESLRSLEEFGKSVNVEFAQRIEQMRYASYTLERALVQGQAWRNRLRDARLCVLVTESLCRASLVGTVKEALLGGAQMIQLREKNVDDRTLLARARDVRDLTRKAGALFIVNDRPDIARLAEADGVHLGQDDLPIHEARRIVGPEILVGVSTHNIEQVRRAVLDGASYIGVGPTFPSVTKSFESLAGLEFIRQAFAETSLPAFAIGGINLGNVAAVRAAGARGIAVSHAVCAAEDPCAMAARLREALSV